MVVKKVLETSEGSYNLTPMGDNPGELSTDLEEDMETEKTYSVDLYLYTYVCHEQCV